MSGRIGDWMQLGPRLAAWPVDPRVEDVNIPAFAQNIANERRYSGANALTVAQHCVMVSLRVQELLEDREPAWRVYAMQGLVHDLHEAVTKDIPRPLKRYLRVAIPGRDGPPVRFEHLESEWQRMICQKLSLPYPFHKMVHLADNEMLALEAVHLFPEEERPLPWGPVTEPAPLNYWGPIWSSEDALDCWITRFRVLGGLGAVEALGLAGGGR